MPIVAASLEEAAAFFCDHINRLLARTITERRLILLSSNLGVSLSFRQNAAPVRARINTKHGPMTLYVGQVCNSTKTAEGRHRLITIEYRYTLSRGSAPEPLFRWEYKRSWPANTTARWCRHHFQGTVDVQFSDSASVSLNDLHLPTGYITLEDVIRFCIVDLEVRPKSDAWHDILQDSYLRFRTDFTVS